jgi:hypothetical protein
MAKRFTDTDKWKDEWYTELSTDYKVIWQYLLDTCDNAGIYKRNIKLLNYYCNTNVSDKDILNVFKLRVTPISDEKWIINKFCVFQYGADFLESKNKAVISVVNKLIENNLYQSSTNTLSIPYPSPINTLSIPYQYPMDTPKEQEQEQEQVKEKAKEQYKEKDKAKEEYKVEVEYEYSDRAKGNTKNIIERMLDVLMDADSDDLKYNRAVEDWKELGGIDDISEIMGWDASQKNNWDTKVNTIYKIKTS